MAQPCCRLYSCLIWPALWIHKPTCRFMPRVPRAPTRRSATPQCRHLRLCAACVSSHLAYAPSGAPPHVRDAARARARRRPGRRPRGREQQRTKRSSASSRGSVDAADASGDWRREDQDDSHRADPRQPHLRGRRAARRQRLGECRQAADARRVRPRHVWRVRERVWRQREGAPPLLLAAARRDRGGAPSTR